MIKRQISTRRRKNQRGNEMIEFALMAVFLVPLLLWMFVNGMNLIRMIQCTQICRDIGNQYIHGLDFSTSSAQAASRCSHSSSSSNAAGSAPNTSVSVAGSNICSIIAEKNH